MVKLTNNFYYLQALGMGRSTLQQEVATSGWHGRRRSLGTISRLRPGCSFPGRLNQALSIKKSPSIFFVRLMLSSTSDHWKAQLILLERPRGYPLHIAKTSRFLLSKRAHVVGNDRHPPHLIFGQIKIAINRHQTSETSNPDHSLECHAETNLAEV